MTPASLKQEILILAVLVVATLITAQALESGVLVLSHFRQIYSPAPSGPSSKFVFPALAEGGQKT